jgi:hypothetical protein
MQRTINRKFRNKCLKDNKLITTHRKPHFGDDCYEGLSERLKDSYFLFLDCDCENKDSLLNKKSNLLGKPFEENIWEQKIEEWIKSSNHEEYYYKMDSIEVDSYLNERKLECEEYGLRLGQSIINKLGNNTPYPNIEIFNSKDENKIIEWFLVTHVK